MENNQGFYTTTQAAKLLSVSPDTVLKWVKAGKIQARRTLGGHFRIPADAVKALVVAEVRTGPVQLTQVRAIQPARPENQQYCWEYHAVGNRINPDCLDCLTYRSRSKRCYELRELPEELGCLRLHCKDTCAECDFYRFANETNINILILSQNRRLVKDRQRIGNRDEMNVEFAVSEYEAARVIERFRPDFVVVDCAYGPRRTRDVCGHLFNDPRIPVLRIILSSRVKKLSEYCDREVFGWIKKPFTLEQLKDFATVVH